MWRNSRRLHHDNAPAHYAFRAKRNITVVEHAHCSPDLAPSDIFLFPRINNTLKGEHFDDIEEIKSNTAIALNGISENDFRACFQSSETRTQKETTSKMTIFNCNKFGK
jgi:hypothetical protein